MFAIVLGAGIEPARALQPTGLAKILVMIQSKFSIILAINLLEQLFLLIKSGASTSSAIRASTK